METKRKTQRNAKECKKWKEKLRPLGRNCRRTLLTFPWMTLANDPRFFVCSEKIRNQGKGIMKRNERAVS